MKTSVPYSLKKILVGIAFVAVPVFVSCEKDPEPAPNGGNNQPQKHNVELVYGKKSDTQWQNISMDTLFKYNSDPTVDTIFMIPEVYNQYSAFSTNQLNSIRTKLRERHNVNPNKIFGKGEMQLWNQSVINNPEIVRFFADTLKYNVTYRNTSKSR